MGYSEYNPYYDMANMAVGYGMSKAQSWLQTQTKKKSSSRRKRMIQTAGKYTGSFPFPYIKAKKDRSRVPFNGSQGTLENNLEAVEGENVSYIGFSSLVRGVGSTLLPPTTYNGYGATVNPVFHFVLSVLKRMFKKHYDVDIESVNQRWNDLQLKQLTAPNTHPSPYEIKIYYQKWPYSNGASGSSVIPSIAVLTSGTFPINGSDPIYKLVVDITNEILNNKEYGAKVNSGELDLYNIYGFSFTDYIDGSFLARGIYRVDNMKISVRCTQTIYVQNQTKSDSDSLSTDVIDSNPIKGRIYYFSDPAPIVRFTRQDDSAGVTEPWRQWKLMYDSNADGIIYPSSDISVSTQKGAPTSESFSAPWTQLPSTDMFTNCKSFAPVALAPGEMRKIKLSFNFTGYVPKFLGGLQLNDATLGGNKQQATLTGNALGTSLLFAFDKRLSTGAGKVEVAIQRHMTTQVSLGRRAQKALEPIRYKEMAVSLANGADPTST